MKKYSKAYIEITNICNLNCSFCPKTARKQQQMTKDNFIKIIGEIDSLTDYLYFHVLGEPTFCDNLKEFVKIGNNKNKKITITTNGTNLSVLTEILQTEKLYKVNVSLQAVGGNVGINTQSYVKEAINFAKFASSRGTLVVLRLWNGGGEIDKNDEIISLLESEFGDIDFCDKDSFTLANKLFLEKADEFQWRCVDLQNEMFCYGLRDQFAILVDGTVTPCCIDSEGEITLGNVFDTPLNVILSSDRATKILNGFTNKTAIENRCKLCGYARRFKI